MCDLLVYVLSVPLCYSNCYYTKSVLLIMLNKIQFNSIQFNVDRDLDDGNSDVNIQGENLERVNTFKYLGATLAENGYLDAEMTHIIQSGCKNWKRISGILCDRRIRLRVKGKYTRQL